MRLTKKYDNEYESNESEYNVWQKLGQLEDIEDDLGIDLVTLFKLINTKKLYAYGHIGIIEVKNNGVNIKGRTIIIYNGVCTSEYALYNYGKYFVLTKEELL